MIEKEIRLEIKKLRRLKLQCRAGTAERLELEHRIKALKKQKAEINTPEPEKEELIKEILKLNPKFPVELVDLRQFTKEQLQHHINCINRKRGIK